MEEFAQDPVLVQEFITESEELLQSMDQDMVQLESSPENDELLNRIFRARHTIKGTSSFLGFDPIVQLGHRAGGLKQKYPIEKLIADLEKVQKGETTPTPAVGSRPEQSAPRTGTGTISSARVAGTCAAAKDFGRRRSDPAGGCSQA